MAADIAPRRSPWDHPTELGLTTRAIGRSCESGSQTTAEQVSRLVAPPRHWSFEPDIFWSQSSPRPKPRSRFGTLTVTSARPLFAKLDCSPLLVFALRTVPATVAFWTSPVAVRLRLDHQCRRPLLDSFFSTSTLISSGARVRLAQSPEADSALSQ